MDLLDRLLGHDESTTMALVKLCSQLPGAELDREHDIGHHTLRGILHHMVRNLEIWTDMMLGRPPRTAPGPSEMQQLESRFQSAYSEFAAHARQTQSAGLMDTTWVDVLDRPPRAKTHGGAIGHLITHNMHHRAAIIHVLRRIGTPGVPEGDLMGWEMRQSREMTAQPARQKQ